MRKIPSGLATRKRRAIIELSAVLRWPSSKRFEIRLISGRLRHRIRATRPRSIAVRHGRRAFRPKMSARATSVRRGVSTTDSLNQELHR